MLCTVLLLTSLTLFFFLNWQSLTWTPYKVWILHIFQWYRPVLDGYKGTRRGAYGWGNALQARGSRVRFPMGSFAFFIDLIFPLCYDLGIDSVSSRNEYQGYVLVVKSAGALGWHTTFMCREPEPPGVLWACNNLNRYCFTSFTLYGYNRP